MNQWNYQYYEKSINHLTFSLPHPRNLHLIPFLLYKNFSFDLIFSSSYCQPQQLRLLYSISLISNINLPLFFFFNLSLSTFLWFFLRFIKAWYFVDCFFQELKLILTVYNFLAKVNNFLIMNNTYVMAWSLNLYSSELLQLRVLSHLQWRVQVLWR